MNRPTDTPFVASDSELATQLHVGRAWSCTRGNGVSGREEGAVREHLEKLSLPRFRSHPPSPDLAPDLRPLRVIFTTDFKDVAQLNIIIIAEQGGKIPWNTPRPNEPHKFPLLNETKTSVTVLPFSNSYAELHQTLIYYSNFLSPRNLRGRDIFTRPGSGYSSTPFTMSGTC